MDKQNKGLAGNNDGDLILNESGTSVSVGLNEEEAQPDSPASSTDKPVAENNVDSEPVSKTGTEEIKAFNDVYPDYQVLQNLDDMQPTGNV